VSYLVGAVIGTLAALGVALIVQGIVGTDAREGRPGVPWRLIRIRAAIAAAGFAVGWLVTGWPAAGVVVAVAAAVVPGLLSARRAREQSLALTEGLAGWAEMLRDTIVSHAGLREAIGVTADVAPEEIRPAVVRLAARAEHESLAVGLRRFADEVADPVADLIVAALAVAADGQARNLPALLSGIATSARAEAHMRMRVETGRARTYSSSRALVGITFALSVLLAVLAPTFMAPFATVWGQLVLVVIAALFGGALWGLVVLSRPAASPRLLAGVADRWGEAGP